MQYEIKYAPSYSTIFAELQSNDRFTVQAGAMSSMSANMQMDTYIPGGFLSGLLRRLLARESFFMNDYYVESNQGEITVAPEMPGRIMQYELGEKGVILLQPSAFLAKIGDIKIGTKFMGFKALFSSEGAFFLNITGSGTLFFNAYGDIEEVDIDGEYIVDTGHVVGFEPSLNFQVTTVGGFKSTLFSGEGLVLKFKGKGKLYLQSRTLGSLVKWIIPFLPK